MKLKLGTGIGSIQFGIRELTLIELLGEADNIVVSNYGDETTKEYQYLKENITYSFSSDDNHRLSSMEVSTSSVKIEGYSIVEKYLHELLDIFESLGLSTPKIDSISNEVEANHLMLYYSMEGLTLSFINYQCDSFSFTPIWKNNEDMIWPKIQEE